MIRHEQSDNFFQRKKNYFRIVHSVKYKKKDFQILDNSTEYFLQKRIKNLPCDCRFSQSYPTQAKG